MSTFKMSEQIEAVHEKFCNFRDNLSISEQHGALRGFIANFIMIII